MRAHYQTNKEPGLLNQSDGLMRNNKGSEITFNSWGCSEQPGAKVESDKMVKLKNLLIINRKLLIYRSIILMVLLMLGATSLWAQGPYPNTGAHTVCIGQIEPYGVINTTGSTYAWSIIPLTGGNGTVAPGNSNLTSVTWTNVGTCNLQVIETNSAGCLGTPVQILITVTPNNTINLTSAVGTNAQTVCVGIPITNITYATTGATGATVTGLPTGVTGAWLANVVTISGTPTVAGAALTYTVTLTGGCGNVTTTGTIAVTANNTVTLTSAVGTNAQTVCVGIPITNITYATTGATGATVTGLPTGVTGAWLANVVTISGTPTVAGAALTYTVTLTGGCGNVTTTGTIAVSILPATSPIYHN